MSTKMAKNQPAKGLPAVSHIPWWLRLWTHFLTIIFGLCAVGGISFWYAIREAEHKAAATGSTKNGEHADPSNGQPPIANEDVQRQGFPYDAFLHLVLPASVLIVEFYMLGRMTLEARERQQEGHERQKTMEEMSSFRIALGRSNYLSQIELAIRTAKEEVLFTSVTMETSHDSDDQKRVVLAVEERQNLDDRKHATDQKCVEGTKKIDSTPAAEKNSTAPTRYIHKGIVAKTPSALPGAIELCCKTRVQVRMSVTLSTTRLRFVIRDQEQSILGVATSAKMQKDGPTSMSFSVDSRMLAESLSATFQKIWEKSITPWQYLDEIIKEMKESKPNITRAEIRKIIEADILEIDDKKLEESLSLYKSI